MRSILFWNIIALISDVFPMYILMSALIEVLPKANSILFSFVLGVIVLVLLTPLILIANIVTLWNEDREEKKKEEVR